MALPSFLPSLQTDSSFVAEHEIAIGPFSER
jgi:hypothetical protein